MSQASTEINYMNEILNLISGGNIEPRIVVFGCGGGGTAIVSRLQGRLKDITTVAINTDLDGLDNVAADRKLHVGKNITFGEDSRGYPEVAEYAAELAIDDIKSCLADKDIAFIVAGMGGGTGTGIAPLVGEMARAMGLVAFGVVVMPFSTEVSRREIANDGVAHLRLVTENTIVLDNDSLLRLNADISLNDAFSVMDRMVANIIDDVRDRMSRSFIATIADDIMAVNSEMGGMIGHASIGHDSITGMENVAIANSNIEGAEMSPQSPIPDDAPNDTALMTSGGMFERAGGLPKA